MSSVACGQHPVTTVGCTHKFAQRTVRTQIDKGELTLRQHVLHTLQEMHGLANLLAPVIGISSFTHLPVQVAVKRNISTGEGDVIDQPLAPGSEDRIHHGRVKCAGGFNFSRMAALG